MAPAIPAREDFWTAVNTMKQWELRGMERFQSMLQFQSNVYMTEKVFRQKHLRWSNLSASAGTVYQEQM